MGGLADNGHFYHGACKCSPHVKNLCTPICQAHVTMENHTIIDVEEVRSKDEEGSRDLIFKVGDKSFRQRLEVAKDARLYPAVSVKRAKVKIFADDADLFDCPRVAPSVFPAQQGGLRLAAFSVAS